MNSSAINKQNGKGKAPAALGLALGAVMVYAAAMVFCSRPNSPPNLSYQSMKKVGAAGKSFMQGWSDALATRDEKPSFQSSFTYDYWIDSAEVTQKRFFDYTGRSPVADASQFGVGDDYPVCFVTWFDAALFCNAWSRSEGLDTVYVYSGVKALPGGSVYELIGLRCDFSRDGYRLPTEAEWEFVAREASSALPFSTPIDSAAAADIAWYFSDASGKTHPVASKRPNALGLYDMAGNVFEWTSDWKGPYDGKNIANSLGAQQPGGEYEKVIKGGGYSHGILYLRPSHRSATYATTISSANEYVGFRCARGVIPGGQYIGTEEQSYVSNPVNVIASNSMMRAFAGAPESKLVFVNVTGQNRTLCCIDFAATMPFVCEFTDDKIVYMPTISPDGLFVAYCSSNEGQSGPSKITIRSLNSQGSSLVQLAPDTAYAPRWLVNRSTGDTCIVYTNSAIMNSSSLWKSTKTFMQKVSGGKAVGSPQMIIADGSYHDGLSADMRYAVSGYNRLMMRDLLTNEEKQLFLSPRNGKDASGSTQVCNVSMAPDTGGDARCLFLDFGYSGTSTVTGCSYGMHQYLFVTSFADSITNFLGCPNGEWDNPEWSNQARFAVATCRNSSDQAHGIYAIDLNSHGYRAAATGTELQQPYWWIGRILENPFNLALDSIGYYDDPPVENGQRQLASMMHFFWQRHNDLDLIFVGNSLIQGGIDGSIFTGYKALNIAGSGLGLLGASDIINDYIVPHAHKVKVIGINIPFYTFAYPLGEVSPESWSNSFCRSIGYLYDKNHNFWKDSLPAGFEKTIAATPYPQTDVGIDSLGLAPWACDGYGGQNPDISGSIDWTVTDSNYLKNFDTFVKIIEKTSVYGIHLIAINFPESPYYKQTDHYLCAGPSWETGKAVLAQLKNLENNYPYFHVYDAYQDGNHDYTDGEAHDFNHLCPVGAKKLSQRLDTLIRKILSR